MKRLNIAGRSSLVLAVLLAAPPRPEAQTPDSLPSPLRAQDVVRLARADRSEVAAAQASATAAAQRPNVVSALDDPMLSPSINHLPYSLDGFDRSITVEQQFPLSAVRRHRREEAEAGFDAAKANSNRTILDVQFDALTAFFMLYERRQLAQILEQQLSLARQVVSAANARYAGATGTQSEVLRAEVDVAQLEASSDALKGEIRAAEAMLNASLGHAANLPIPPLEIDLPSQLALNWDDLKTRLPSDLNWTRPEQR